jgi:hypothetical protein
MRSTSRTPPKLWKTGSFDSIPTSLPSVLRGLTQTVAEFIAQGKTTIAEGRILQDASSAALDAAEKVRVREKFRCLRPVFHRRFYSPPFLLFFFAMQLARAAEQVGTSNGLLKAMPVRSF